MSVPSGLRVFRNQRRLTGSGRQAGFSLIELSIVLMVIAIAVGGISRVGTHLGAQKRLHERRAALESARQALIAYALVHGRLPCPALNKDNGIRLEARSGTSCQGQTGLVPTTSLGVRIPQSIRLHYSVSPEFTDDQPRSAGAWPCVRQMQFASFNLCDRGKQRIYAGQPLTTGNLIANNVVAVLVEPGAQTPPKADESENLDGDQTFIRAGKTRDFDDELVWISDYTLKYQLTSVGMMH